MAITRLLPGLVSITFRKLSWEQVLEASVKAGLAGIEWGGDVHVPHGDGDHARRVGEATRAAGLAMPTYGSYLRAGQGPEGGGDVPSFDEVLRSAEGLGAGAIRVWAGLKGSDQTNASERAAVVADLVALCDRAADRDLGVTLEYHRGTLTDTADSTIELLDAADRPNLSTLWQTTNGASDDHSLDNLRRLQTHVLHAHVFDWDKGMVDQRALSAGADRWGRFLPELAHSGRDERFCLLEFVKGGTLEQFHEDAATLKGWIETLPAS